MSSPCVILEISGSDNWEAFRGCKRIPVIRQSTVLHPSREVAQSEAKRLAGQRPWCQFLVLEAVSMGLTLKVTTHVSLTGLPLIEGTVPAVVQIWDAEAEIPF